MSNEAGSAFIVRVPEAEACVGELRARYDASARLGVPAHITLLYPFMPPRQIDRTVLSRAEAAFASVPAFSFRLHEVARFPAAAYLKPVPAAPFIALTEALVRAFPRFPPFGGAHAEVIPHLTVATGDAAQAEIAADELRRTMQSNGPIGSFCSHVSLLENASGAWREMHVFALPRR